MCGRDVVVNSNRGIAGIVRATGAVEAFQPSNIARVVKCEARPSSRTTIYSHLRNLAVPLFVMLSCVPIFVRRK
jgi:apolipoprotein N-acyltransferase